MSPETPVVVVEPSTNCATDSPMDRAAFGDTLICPRCAYNLRGLTSDRCPECGLSLDWPAVIAAARRRVESPTFESHWRERPVASFFGTLWLSIQPWKIWKRIPLTSEPQIGALIVFVGATLPTFFLAEICFRAFEDLFTGIYFQRRGRSYRFFEFFGYPGSLAEFSRFQLVRYGILFGLGLFAYVALLIFQRSLLGYRIRRSHILRMAAMVFASLLTVQLINEVVRVIAGMFEWLYASPLQATARWASIVVDIAILTLPAWSITCAARDYLRVRRPWQFGAVILLLSILLSGTVHVGYCVIADRIDNALTRAGGDLWPGIDYALAWINWWCGYYD